ncbi:hypothetical protein OE88DRAFT_258904 [Heliocybe sulcata]|uniref:Uncharacterized protein n=1 Tax=Heliocybe sulcata TaxID=5364 RepID=A0A5C3MZK1_9AGAM|nr:hypothetical protein OE88DRAFT_258904 [Heliocybe sulcata]
MRMSMGDRHLYAAQLRLEFPLSSYRNSDYTRCYRPRIVEPNVVVWNWKTGRVRARDRNACLPPHFWTRAALVFGRSVGLPSSSIGDSSSGLSGGVKSPKTHSRNPRKMREMKTQPYSEGPLRRLDPGVGSRGTEDCVSTYQQLHIWADGRCTDGNL